MRARINKCKRHCCSLTQTQTQRQRQRDRQAERQTDKHTHTHTHMCALPHTHISNYICYKERKTERKKEAYKQKEKRKCGIRMPEIFDFS